MKKRIFLVLVIVLPAVTLFAQKYDDIKNALILGKADEANFFFDKSVTNSIFFTKPEGYLIKAALFARLAADSSKVEDKVNNMAEAAAAFEKYREVDPETKLLEENQAYKNTPYNIYASYYNAGIADINNKKYDLAYEEFKHTVYYSDFLISKKILNKQMDTAAIYYAGLLAENTSHLDEAMGYYIRLSDANIKEYQGASYAAVYQGLVRYYAGKRDKANFEKYRILGRVLYPHIDFFTYKISDFWASK
ncbi:hypothetical protein [Niabella aquatica]